jgi:hypothetical protein
MNNIKYYHGSEDSLDVDVYYVFDKMPNFNDCRKFCSEDENENRNIITIEDGIVSNCFIGTIDEINNGLLDTYNLHKQDYELLITKRVDRDIIIKDIRVIRGILSIISRTEYRQIIKYALNNKFSDRINCLKEIDFAKIDFYNLGKHTNGKDALKVIAFQFGQILSLYDGIECYTKSSICNIYDDLTPFLYRHDNVDLNILNKYKDKLVNLLSNININEDGRICYFLDENRKIDLVHENDV